MKIRMGFVTNSSSTNFMIISKKELTAEYLFERLGFKQNSPWASAGLELCENILYGTERGLRWHDITTINYENIKKIFGDKTAELFRDKSSKGFYVYLGYISSDQGALTCFFTSDSFEIDDPDLYINGKNCVW